MLPGALIRLRAVKPELADELSQETLPALLRRRRRALGLKTTEAADVFRIAEWSYRSWERGLSEPAARNFPKVIEFLGREPWPTPITLCERLQAARLRRGLNMEELAADIGLLPAAVYRFQTHERSSRRKREKIRAYVEVAEAELRSDANVKRA